ATVGVPIRWGDRFLGVLNVLDDAPRTFSPADVALLERFAPLAAAALEQARLLDEAQRRAAELGILYDVITAATTSAYLDGVLNQTMGALRQALTVDGIAILLVEPETGDLINRAVAGFPGASALVGQRMDAGLGIVGWVARTGQPALVPDVRKNGRYQEYDPDTLSELCVPLRVRSRTIGVLNLESHQLGAFTESDLSLVSTLAGNLATVIDNAWLVQTLRESEEKYRTLVKTSPEAVTATDLEGRITDLSQQALELHRAKRIEELLGKSAFDLIAPEDRDRAMINVQKTLKEGLVRNVEYTMLRKDGSRFTGELSAALIKDASGNPQAFIATVRDVTERKRLEEQLRQAQKMEAIGTLAGGIAHDFNNLLGGILGFASLMERDLPADSPLRTSVETIISTARRGAELTNQLLAFARGGRYEVFPTSLNDVTREVVRLLSRTVDKAIAIETHLTEELASVEGDAGQLHQMLLNLCLNACEAMPAGGQLTIETENVTLSAKEAQAAMELEPGPYVRLRVTDTGIGMDAETMQHIFEPFFTTKKGRPGKQHSGLGLSMVYGIVRSHDGAIRVHSELGQGSTFEVYLPAIERPAAVTTAPTIEATAGSETVLVVDDEDFIRTLLQQALEGAGYTVLLAEDGPQALEVYRQRGKDIDLVVLDMGLPRLSGLETFQQLWEIDPQAVVLISSGYAEDDRTQTVLAAGARGFLAKPYDLDELLHKIRQVLDRET
ncbi:MAG: response regulator, partial [Promethearchaeota archaeon]